MNKLKVKISDEPRIIVSAIVNPFQVILSFKDSNDNISGLVIDEHFEFSTDDNIEFTRAVSKLIANKINFQVEF